MRPLGWDEDRDPTVADRRRKKIYARSYRPPTGTLPLYQPVSATSTLIAATVIVGVMSAMIHPVVAPRASIALGEMHAQMAIDLADSRNSRALKEAETTLRNGREAIWVNLFTPYVNAEPTVVSALRTLLPTQNGGVDRFSRIYMNIMGFPNFLIQAGNSDSKNEASIEWASRARSLVLAYRLLVACSGRDFGTGTDASGLEGETSPRSPMALVSYTLWVYCRGDSCVQEISEYTPQYSRVRHARAEHRARHGIH